MDSLLLTGGYGARSASDVAVSEESSLRNTAVLAAARAFGVNLQGLTPQQIMRMWMQ